MKRIIIAIALAVLTLTGCQKLPVSTTPCSGPGCVEIAIKTEGYQNKFYHNDTTGKVQDINFIIRRLKIQ